MEYFDYNTALSLGTSFLAITLVAFLLAFDGAFDQLKTWPDRVHAAGWRWPLTVILGITLAFALWQIADAMRVIWLYHQQ